MAPRDADTFHGARPLRIPDNQKCVYYRIPSLGTGPEGNRQEGWPILPAQVFTCIVSDTKTGHVVGANLQLRLTGIATGRVVACVKDSAQRS